VSYDGYTWTDLSTAEIYSPIADSVGTLSATGPMPSPVSGHEAVLLNTGDVLLAGGSPIGHDDGSTLAMIFKSAARTFRFTAGQLNVRRWTPVLVRMGDGRVLVVGGSSSDVPGGWGFTDKAEVYDPNSDAFSVMSERPVTRETRGGLLLSSGAVLITGGSGNDYGGPSSTELYCP
jgi:hypothetical protein